MKKVDLNCSVHGNYEISNPELSSSIGFIRLRKLPVISRASIWKDRIKSELNCGLLRLEG
ncbi:hypothetical protein Gogos_005620 [Gossypium gossypioides]|uniref:Uncharacterized protein n=1 Tax=Gossypium gossypioides TaxID=34282 RepID=A0A7J9CXD0_GOSGO|nr:hypothetical protein [Gossypium gossypioides]